MEISQSRHLFFIGSDEGSEAIFPLFLCHKPSNEEATQHTNILMDESPQWGSPEGKQPDGCKHLPVPNVNARPSVRGTNARMQTTTTSPPYEAPLSSRDLDRDVASERTWYLFKKFCCPSWQWCCLYRGLGIYLEICCLTWQWYLPLERALCSVIQSGQENCLLWGLWAISSIWMIRLPLERAFMLYRPIWTLK